MSSTSEPLALPAAKAGSNREAKVISLVAVAHFMSHVHGMLLPPILGQVKEAFGVSYTQVALAITVFNIASALLQTPTGFLVAGAANPLVDTVARLEAKVDSGMGLLQTNIVYDVDRFAEWFASLVEAGLPAELATKLARETVAGSGELLHRSELSSATLRQNVTSPGGTTAAALEVLMGADGMQSLLTRAVTAATKRSRELAK